MSNRSAVLLIVCASFLFAFTATSSAAPPPNDLRDGAVSLSVPQSVSGTTVEATLETGEPAGTCDYGSKASVWYRITGARGYLALALEAQGDLDASIAVFKVVRSEAEELDCGRTGSSGLGVVNFRATSSAVYLVRVAERQNSVSGTFDLRTIRAEDDDPAPRRLPANGRSDTVNFASNPVDLWRVKLRSGVTYRFNLATGSSSYCVNAILAGEGTTKRLTCHDGYTLFTPGAGEGGSYDLTVTTGTRVLANQRYHLQVARAGSDDTGPGLFWGGTSRGGSLSGGHIDVADLYYWRLTRRSVVDLSVGGKFDVTLLSARGRQLAAGYGGEGIERRLSPGQYFVMVSASDEESGRYKLRRIEKVITSTSVTFNGSRDAVSSPGGVTVTGRVNPASSGTIEISIDRYDPVFGWQFFRKVSGGGGGSYSTSFSTSGPGRWRAKAVFKGSKHASRSSSGYARLKVVS